MYPRPASLLASPMLCTGQSGPTCGWPRAAVILDTVPGHLERAPAHGLGAPSASTSALPPGPRDAPPTAELWTALWTEQQAACALFIQVCSSVFMQSADLLSCLLSINHGD